VRFFPSFPFNTPLLSVRLTFDPVVRRADVDLCAACRYVDTVTSFAWEPKGERFGIVSTNDPNLATPGPGITIKYNVSFYQLDTRKGDFKLFSAFAFYLTFLAAKSASHHFADDNSLLTVHSISPHLLSSFHLTHSSTSFSPHLACELPSSPSRFTPLSETLDNKSCNRIFWSPRGRQVVLATFESSQKCDIEFWDLDFTTDESAKKPENSAEWGQNVQLLAATEHYGMTDIAWDPSGRYCTSHATSWKPAVSCSAHLSFLVFASQGVDSTMLMPLLSFCFTRFPRPCLYHPTFLPSLVSIPLRLLPPYPVIIATPADRLRLRHLGLPRPRAQT
jgi:hypothetical protein